MALVSAVVTDEEKSQIRALAARHNMKESDFVRYALKKAGAAIEIKKAVGAPVGNNNNPGGNPNFAKKKKKSDD